MSDTVTEIAVTDLSAMQREVNQGLMVAFINRELVDRASLDVRDAIVFYDADKDFAFAAESLPDEETLQRLAETTKIRFWSRGC